MSMLINLETVHKPQTIDEAAALIERQGVYPLYGGGAYLLRAAIHEAHSAVDMGAVVSAGFSSAGSVPWLGACATLETMGAFDGHFRLVVDAEAPLNLRNTLTLGDMLLETPSDSPLMALLVGLEARVVCYAHPSYSMEDWFRQGLLWRTQRTILRVELPGYNAGQVSIAFEKVARTPADRPIVAALAIWDRRYEQSLRVVVLGMESHPVWYVEGMQSTLEDFKGSAEYRTAVMPHLVEMTRAKVRT